MYDSPSIAADRSPPSQNEHEISPFVIALAAKRRVAAIALSESM
jgi:hypothetical protein